MTPRSRDSVEQVAATLRPTCDAVLVPDHGARHGDFPSLYLAAVLVGMGIRPWVTLSCRDKNRAALAADCAALSDMGVAGVHCVTGDWQATGEAQVFDLDATRLVETAAARGLPVSVAASPAAPPVAARPRLLASKAAAGASVCFVNHCGGPPVVGPFVEAALEAGAAMSFVPCVPVVSDPEAAARLAALPGLVLEEEIREAPAVGIHPAIDRAIEEIRRMLDIPGVNGVNLSGSASSHSVEESARMMAAVGQEVMALVEAR